MKNINDNCKIPVLFKLLSERKISAKKLSDDTGISTGNISDWKVGKSKPSSEKIKILASYFNVTTDYLLGNDTDEKENPATDRQLKFALFGDAEIDDEVLDDIKRIAKLQMELRKQKENKK